MHEPNIEDDDRALSDIFHFHPLTIEDARSDRHHPKIEEFPNYLFFIVHGVNSDDTSEHFSTTELDGYLGSNYVITYHHLNFPSIEKVRQRVRSSPVSCQRGAAFLLHGIIDAIVDDYAPVLDHFDERITDLEDRIFALKQPDNSILQEVQELKRGILRLRRTSAKQLDILYRMSHGEFSIIPESALPFYRDIYDHLVRVADLAENYRDLISSTLDSYLSVVSNRLNEIMKVLTIISAIGVPLTVIVGIYGMNFENMPELHSQYGYYFVWIAMILVASGMLIYFRRRGWLGGDKGNDER
jgi:magnesium transporter